jgi:hypothetical protein
MMLLEEANVSVTGLSELTPLHYATGDRDLPLIELLLNRLELDPNITDLCG